MAINSITITIKIKIAWWVRWYIAGVSLRALLTGLEPDFEKVARTVRRGLRVR